jgi:hypothetical protein
MSYGKRMMSRRGLRTVSNIATATEKEQESKKLIPFKLPQSVRKLIENDALDNRLWDDVLKQVLYSKYEFLHYLFDSAFVCTSGACSKPIKVSWYKEW